MRVNMDSSIASDPRFKLVAAALDVKWTEVIGSCFLLWLACYDRRSERLRKVEADIAAEMKGFAQALVEEGLADDCGDEIILIHGVRERIEFLVKQAERGAKGGKSKGKRKPKRTPSERQANDQADAKANASDTAKAYTLTPDLSPSQDQKGQKKKVPNLPSDKATNAAEYLRRKIIRQDPDSPLAHTFTEAQHIKWAKTLDLLNSKDQQSWEDIKKAIDWIFDTENTFVILSAASLRKKFGNLRHHIRKTTAPTKLPPHRKTPPQFERITGESQEDWAVRYKAWSVAQEAKSDE